MRPVALRQIGAGLLLMLSAGLMGCSPRAMLASAAAGPANATLVPTATLTLTPTDTPTATPLPTTTATSTLPPTATPTSTATPTVTPSPTSTRRPTAQPTLEVVQGEAGQYAYTVTLPITSQAGITRWVQMNYLLYLPQNYQSVGAWPLIVFLHGSGERGYNAELLARTGLPQMLENRSDFPFIVLSPQVPTDQWWEDQLAMLPVLIAQIETHYPIDVKREYLTGLSMGGFGAWAVALRYPQKFAAVVPIAGGWNGADMPRNICALKDVPVWVFHGEQDMNVFPQQTEQMVKALQACGGSVRFTLYPDADHDGSWQRAYTDPELYEWLLAQHLP